MQTRTVSPRQSALIVDDAPAIRALFRARLEAGGLRVHEAADGVQAVGQHLRHWPGLIIMDFDMPVLDGFTATRWLRAVGATSFILGCSQDVSAPRVARAKAAGMDQVTGKQVPASVLHAALGRAFGRVSF